MRTASKILRGLINSRLLATTTAEERAAADEILAGALSADGGNGWRVADHDNRVAIRVAGGTNRWGQPEDTPRIKWLTVRRCSGFTASSSTDGGCRNAAHGRPSYFACNSISLLIALMIAFAAVSDLACVLQQILERPRYFSESASWTSIQTFPPL
jgi:hypothetical protein